MLQSHMTFPPFLDRLVRRSRVRNAVATSTVRSTPPQIAAPANAFCACVSGVVVRTGPTTGADARAAGGVGAGGVSVLTAAKKSTLPEPTRGSHPPGG